MNPHLALAVLGLSAALLSACPDDPKRRIGATCDNDEQCSSGLCYEQRCLSPVADDDADTLRNEYEILLQLDPFEADTDLDGKRDADELNSDQSIIDSDGDGRIDALESALADADDDCIVDELDPDDADADPDGCVGAYRSCFEVYDAGLGTGAYTVDPDGDGPEPAQLVQCQNAAGASWTRLTDDWRTWLGKGAVVTRAYLLVAADGSFVLSPPTATPWSWDNAQSLAGTWFYQANGGALRSFDCFSSIPDVGPGVGCFDPQDLLAVEPQASNAQPASGDLDVCLTGVAGLSGCARYAVFEREVACVPDAASVVGDGGFDRIATDPRCWTVDRIDEGGAGLGGNIFIDTDPGAAPSPPSIRAELYVPAGADGWFANLKQDELHLGEGHAYRWLFDAKASEPRPMVVDVSATDAIDPLAFDTVALTTQWQRFELPVTPEAATLDAHLRFFFGYDGEAPVHLDNVTLVDAGNACSRAPDQLVGNGEFEAGLACWTSVIAAAGIWRSVVGGGLDDSNYIMAESYDGSAQSFALLLNGLPIQSGHGYAVSVSIRGAGEYRLDLAVTSQEVRSFVMPPRHVTSAWTTYTGRFYVEPGAANTLPWTFVLGASSAGPGGIDIDGVSVVDLGTGTALCADGDPGFDFGLLCWPGTGVVAEDFAVWNEGSASASPPSIKLENPGGTLSSEVRVSRPVSLAGGTSYDFVMSAIGNDAQPFNVQIVAGSETLIYQGDFTASTAWQELRGGFTVPAGPSVQAVITVNTGGPNANVVWIDDVRVTPVGP